MSERRGPGVRLMNTREAANGKNPNRSVFLLIAFLGVVSVLLFWPSFKRNQTLFSNDGPLAVQANPSYQLPAAFTGVWVDQHWLGMHGGHFSPNLTGLMRFLLSPLLYTNFHAAIAIVFLGVCAWIFFRQVKFGPWVSCLAALAAAFNTNFVSNAGWGLSSRALSLAMIFLALAAIESSFRRHAIIKTILAGLAIGMSISEGGDNGAIFSLFVAAFAFVRTLLQDGAVGARIAKGVGRVVLMAAFAAVLAAQILNLFVDVAVKGIVGTQQDEMTREQKWDWATMWSLPKSETLRVIIPGLYGYRMDTPEGGQYWGRVGQQPGVETSRYSGAGEYAGVLVVLIGVFAIAQSFRRTNSPYSELERRMVWFWGAAAVLAMLLGWGRHAPFYQFVYALPYFSTIRNPMKFFHPLHLALMILFAYGLQALWRSYIERSVQQPARAPLQQFKGWWAKAPKFDKRWTLGLGVALAVSFVGFLAYASARGALVSYLSRVGFNEFQSTEIAGFSIREVGLFLVFLIVSVAAVLLVQSGFFAGARARWAGVLLGAILVVDLARANTPWIQYYNYQERYASNPVIDVLKDKPYEHRVVVMPPFRGQPQQLSVLQQVYHVEWLQHHFQYYNVQSLNVAQEPRLPEDKAAYLQALDGKLARYWQLTNTRYILGLAGQFADVLNQQLDPQQQRFKQRIAFDFYQVQGSQAIGVTTNTTGPYALIEFTGALPRATLYTRWEVSTNEQATLSRLADPAFDSFATVLVAESDSISQSKGSEGTEATAATAVEITSYEPRAIKLKTRSEAPAVLLLNDRFHPSWNVYVDGEREELLRCNFVMRGVYLPSAEHNVEFRFELQPTTFYLTLGAVILGILLCSYLGVDYWRRRSR